MEVTVHFTGQLAQATGRKAQTWEGPPEATVGDLISSLAGHGAAADRSVAELLLDPQGQPRASLLVVIDGEQAAPGWPGLSVSGVRTVTLMTPIAGG
jgi:molybdopterin converting factor small subunit